MEIDEKYKELKSFLITHVDEYWDGKNDEKIINEELKDKKKLKYYKQFSDSLNDFLRDESYSQQYKVKFLQNTNLYCKNEDEYMAWAQKLANIIDNLTIQN